MGGWGLQQVNPAVVGRIALLLQASQVLHETGKPFFHGAGFVHWGVALLKLVHKVGSRLLSDISLHAVA